MPQAESTPNATQMILRRLRGRAHLAKVVFEDRVVGISEHRGLVREAVVAAEGVWEQQVVDGPAPVGVVLLERSGALEPVSL